MLRGIHLTALVIRYTLIPPSPENAVNNREAVVASSGYVSLNGDNVRFYLADFNRAVNREGKLRLLFPGCLVLAAPLLLFRLKREGFSNCRALLTAEGILLSATR